MTQHEITFTATAFLQFPVGRTYADIDSVSIDENSHGETASYEVSVCFRGDSEPHSAFVNNDYGIAHGVYNAVMEQALRAQPMPQP